MMNWSERIEAARVKGFTQTDRELANDWVTCACGEQDPRIPSIASFSNQPEDQALIDYGCAFYLDVGRNDPNEAAKTLDKIEIRSAQILADLGYREA